jgi:serine protease Do
MQRAALLAAGLSAVVTIAWLPPAPARADELVTTLADRVATLLPAVVNIETITVTPSGTPGQPPVRGSMVGSGFIIDPSGYIVTNHHVIAGGVAIQVSGRGIPAMKARPVFIGNRVDIAVLKVDYDKPLPAVQFGDSDKLQVGDPVLAIGNPLGIGESVSAGIISALNRNLSLTPYDDFIQTDAAINHGNSGGPMFNLAGQVVGVDTALFSPGTETGSVGLGFALPSNLVKFIVDQVITTGTVRAGYLGLRAQKITPRIAAAIGFPDTNGAIVSEVDDPGPAAGKIQVGDIILKVDDKSMADVRAAARFVAMSRIGDVIPLQIWRNNTQLTVPVAIADLPDPPLPPAPTASQLAVAAPTDPGLSLAPITPALRMQYSLTANQKGVVITNVSQSGSAAVLGLSSGDVILRVGTSLVNTPAEVRQRLAELRKQKRSDALVLVQTQGVPRWVALPLTPGQIPTPT